MAAGAASGVQDNSCGLRSCSRRCCPAICERTEQEAPVLPRGTLQQRSPASLTGLGFFPDSLLASCGTLAPPRLSSRSQPQSSPWDLTSEARASAPSPHPSRRASRQVSQAGGCWSVPILRAGISSFCLLHPSCCALLRGSEASPPRPHH